MKKKSLQYVIMLTRYSAYGFLLHLLLLTSLSAMEGNAQKRSIKEVNADVRFKNVAVEKVLQSIEQQTEFVFVYTPEDLRESGKITLNMTNSPVSDILTEISRQSELQFKQVNESISVKRMEKTRLAERNSREHWQAQTITGKVTSDESPDGLPGVNVIIKGTTQGTVTDVNGDYAIDIADPETILVFTSVGYVAEEIPVGNRSRIDVLMIPDITALEEIVVVGYGSMERANVTGSIVTVNVEEVQKTPIPNAVEALRGRVPGLQVTRGSGQPGSDVTFRIRGTNSLGGANQSNNPTDRARALNDANQPILVIDGVPVPGSNLAEINPDDIESMNILKDAAASAIYGSSGANGAILITTKRGKKGAAQFSAEASTGFVNLANRLDMMDGEEYVRYLLDSRIAVGETNPTVTSVLDPIELNNYLNGNFADWQDLMIQTGRQHNISLGASGGGDNFSFYVNGDAYLEEGVITHSDYKRYSLRVNTDYKPTRWLQIGARINLVRSDADETSNVISDFNVDGAFAPYIPLSTNTPLGNVYDENGNLSKTINTDQFQVNPLHRYNESVADRFVNRVYVNPYMNVEIGHGFTYTLNTFVESRDVFYGRFQSSNYADVPSEAQIQETTNKNYLLDNILTYNKDFGRHGINATLVYGMQKFEYEQLNTVAQYIPTDLLGYNAIGHALDNRSRIDWNTDENGRMYQVGRIGYNYDGRYALTVSLRRDASSKFGPNYRHGYFPSASLAWNADREAFVKNIDFLSQLKMRLSYGVLGNDNIGTYLYRAAASNIQILLGVDEDGNEVTFNGYGVGNNASNPNLRWEESQQSNIGIDFGFLNNRITGSVDLWQTNTKDLLLYESIISVNGGYREYPSNIGETRNRGIDVGLSGWAIQRPDFSWNVIANWSVDRNEIVQLSRADTDEEGNPVDNPANGWFIGQDIRVIYDYKYTGVWQLGEESAAAEFGAVPGDPKIADVDGNGVIDSDDRTFLGSPTPRWYGGLTNIFNYKGFELSFLIEAVQGVTQVNTYIGGFTGRGNQVNINYWTPDNPSNEFPRVGNGNAMAGGLFANAIKVQDASFVALRNISIGYHLPSKIVQKIPFTGVNIYVRGNNLKYWTDYTLAFSPESGPGSYPITRTWIFGTRLTF